MAKDPNRLYAEDGGEMFTEFPFFREGMLAEEFDQEEEYYFIHYDDVRKGTYKSLRDQGYFDKSAKA